VSELYEAYRRWTLPRIISLLALTYHKHVADGSKMQAIPPPLVRHAFHVHNEKYSSRVTIATMFHYPSLKNARKRSTKRMCQVEVQLDWLLALASPVIFKSTDLSKMENEGYQNKDFLSKETSILPYKLNKLVYD